MNATDAREIVKHGVVPGDFDSIAVAEARGYLKAIKGPEVKALVEALEKIANHGYRGSRSTESQLALTALASYRRAESDE